MNPYMTSDAYPSSSMNNLRLVDDEMVARIRSRRKVKFSNGSVSRGPQLALRHNVHGGLRCKIVVKLEFPFAIEIRYLV
jgi:hypothetical protein